MKSPTSRMAAINSDMAALQAKKQPSGQPKLDQLHGRYEKTNKIIEPMAQ
jgi:hypothetical protein